MIEMLVRALVGVNVLTQGLGSLPVSTTCNAPADLLVIFRHSFRADDCLFWGCWLPETNRNRQAYLAKAVLLKAA
jgi:hypothetical protein